MKATLRGEVIADSDTIREAAGYTYFPRGTVRMELLRKAPKIESDLACPHGVQFYDVTVNSAESKRAAWSYEDPRPAMSHVDHWVSFWKDVKVE